MIGFHLQWNESCHFAFLQVGTKYAELTGQDKDVVITRYFGIFFLFFQSTQVWGNLISSTGACSSWFFALNSNIYITTFVP